jgi:hypothetical protein
MNIAASEEEQLVLNGEEETPNGIPPNRLMVML